jgi:hypothetical protein
MFGELFGASGVMNAAPAAAPYAGPPIMGKFQTERYHENFNKLTPGEQEYFQNLLYNTKNPTEMDYLMKSLASGHKVTTIGVFADQIRGKSDEWLHKNLRLTDDKDSGAGLKQQWNCSCAPTTAEVVRGEMDPIYSLTVHRKNQDVTADDPRTGLKDTIDAHGGKKVGNHNVADEQREILEKHGGEATERKQGGGDGMSTDDALNEMSRWTGVTYEDHDIQPPALRRDLSGVYKDANDMIQDKKMKEAFTKMDSDLAAGIPCALSITDSKDKGGHAVAVTGVTGTGADKTYIIHDPWSGQTVYVKASDLEKGNVVPKIAGWDLVRTIYASK